MVHELSSFRPAIGRKDERASVAAYDPARYWVLRPPVCRGPTFRDDLADDAVCVQEDESLLPGMHRCHLSVLGDVA